MKNKTLTTAIIIALLIGWASAALYEAGTYFKPENSNIGYIIGENSTYDIILTNVDNITFNMGAQFITYNAASASPGNITLYTISTTYINHTCDLNAETSFKVGGLLWSQPSWIIYQNETLYTYDTASDLNYTIPGWDDTHIQLIPGNIPTTPTTSTLMPYVPVDTNSSSVTAGIPARPCFELIMNLKLLEGILCPFEQAFGGG